MSAPLFVIEPLAPSVRIGRPLSATADAATDRLTMANHGFIAGSQLRLVSGTAPGGLAVGTTYFVVNPTTNDLQLAAALGGAPIDLTTAGANLVFKAHNTALDGSGHLRLLFDNAPSSAYTRAVRFDLIRVKALEATALGMIRIFKRRPAPSTDTELIAEQIVPAIGTVGTPLGAGVRTAEFDIPTTGFVLEPGEALLAATHEPQTFSILLAQAGRMF